MQIVNDKRMMVQAKCDLRAEQAEDGKKMLRGYPILFDSPAKIGEWTEYVRKGALDGVDLSGLMLLGFHDTNCPLAVNGVNMRVEVDDTGLFIEAELPDTTQANDVYELVDKKIISGMSYWFGATDVRTNIETKTDEILKFKWVKEVSVVTFPAYPETVVIAFEKSKADEQKIPTVKKILI
jgi:hypothetical protein